MGRLLEKSSGEVSFAIDPQLRRQGLGAMTLEHLIEEDRSLAIENGELARFVQRRGFTVQDGRFVPPRKAAKIIRGASAALWFSETREVMVGLRLLEPLRNNHAFPGGKVEPGESALQAAIRELEEESGIALLAEEKPLIRTRVHGGGGAGVVYELDCFTFGVTARHPPRSTPEMRSEWLPLARALSLEPMAPGTRRVLARMIDLL